MRPFHNVHPDFRLNNVHYTFTDLKEVAYSFIKEGRPFEKVIGVFLLDWLDDSDFVTVHTSGSTGIPKPISLKKEHMVNSALATGSFFGLSSGDKALHCLPTGFIAGKMMLVRALVLGLHIDVVTPSSSPLQQVEKRYDFGAMVPLQLQNSIENIDIIDTLIIGGAPLSGALKAKVKKMDAHIFETYGMTETITHIAVKQINKTLSIGTDNVDDVFTALPNVYFEIDERGCLIIDAPKISNIPIITNDIVDLISTTKFRWLGRYDNIINSGGIKLIPEQIESILSQTISNTFFVAGLPDDMLGESLVLVVEGNISVEHVKKILNKTNGLSKHQIPKDVFVLPKFSKAKNGKINRSNTLALLTT
ncbi:AMP-binding protein [Costertonia aggregata]|uniref:AMP-binding protein n=1 Tax=Costertonia aggregata TaxID=343403 RepID=A0A7H9AUI4_9FLAO|nr:AMP-binding protein [Costertonia aggregata]QLG47153.1 AMP-binding protein [Costertonia aggregata]